MAAVSLAPARVRIFARVRPDDGGSDGEPLRFGERSITHAGREYAFDRVFAPGDDTAAVYRAACEPLVARAADGFAGAMFAYGQTGSGKTHTIFGDDHAPGLARLAAQALFDLVRQRPQCEFAFKMALMEIVDEKAVDLLNARAPVLFRTAIVPAEQPAIAQPHAHAPAAPARQLTYHGLSERAVTSERDVVASLEEGLAARTVGANYKHARSSRSHVVLRLTAEAAHRLARGAAGVAHPIADDGRTAELGALPPVDASLGPLVTVGSFTLVDLAGSESASANALGGAAAAQGAGINRSLLFLRQAVRALGATAGANAGVGAGAGANAGVSGADAGDVAAGGTGSGAGGAGSAGGDGGGRGAGGTAHASAGPSLRNSLLTRLLEPALSGAASLAMICTLPARVGGVATGTGGSSSGSGTGAARGAPIAAAADACARASPPAGADARQVLDALEFSLAVSAVRPTARAARSMGGGGELRRLHALLLEMGAERDAAAGGVESLSAQLAEYEGLIAEQRARTVTAESLAAAEAAQASAQRAAASAASERERALRENAELLAAALVAEEAERKAAEERLAAAAAELSGTEARVAELAAALDAAATERTRLVGALGHVEARLAGAAAAVDERSAELERMRRGLAEREVELAQRGEQLGAREAQLNDLAAARARLEAALAASAADADAARAESEALSARAARADAALADQARSLALRDGEVGQLRAASAALADAVAEAERRAADARAGADAAAAASAAAHTNVSRLSDRLRANEQLLLLKHRLRAARVALRRGDANGTPTRAPTRAAPRGPDGAARDASACAVSVGQGSEASADGHAPASRAGAGEGEGAGEGGEGGARRAVRPQLPPADPRFAVVTRAYLDAPYLGYQVEWYRALGFGRFVIINTERPSDVGTVAQRWDPAFVVVIRSGARERQGLNGLYQRHARAITGTTAEWVLVVDSDEFLLCDAPSIAEHVARVERRVGRLDVFAFMWLAANNLAPTCAGWPAEGSALAGGACGAGANATRGSAGVADASFLGMLQRVRALPGHNLKSMVRARLLKHMHGPHCLALTGPTAIVTTYYHGEARVGPPVCLGRHVARPFVDSLLIHLNTRSLASMLIKASATHLGGLELKLPDAFSRAVTDPLGDASSNRTVTVEQAYAAARARASSARSARLADGCAHDTSIAGGGLSADPIRTGRDACATPADGRRAGLAPPVGAGADAVYDAEVLRRLVGVVGEKANMLTSVQAYQLDPLRQTVRRACSAALEPPTPTPTRVPAASATVRTADGAKPGAASCGEGYIRATLLRLARAGSTPIAAPVLPCDPKLELTVVTARLASLGVRYEAWQAFAWLAGRAYERARHAMWRGTHVWTHSRLKRRGAKRLGNCSR
ncbi:hypothetical protein KFE25_012405 [Diacronema lutheri]|uniref:Kinesin motor domain-containing protein n=1 Tax=Diacronema lutheri TaxID=2081491 RepID=A0A8J5XIU1_DIALT|nr:hypothetical protein KFE25_012405 [Diacronema lutheri]